MTEYQFLTIEFVFLICLEVYILVKHINRRKIR